MCMCWHILCNYFNKIYIIVRGPYHLPEGMDDPEKFEAFRRYIENELLEITYEGFQKTGQKIPQKLMNLFPPDWEFPQEEVALGADIAAEPI